VHPVWHPNIDCQSGYLRLPLQWSPLLSLISIAEATVDALLTPSVDFAANALAARSYAESPQLFAVEVRDLRIIRI
jgi:ubiquitin-protein ligase